MSTQGETKAARKPLLSPSTRENLRIYKYKFSRNKLSVFGLVLVLLSFFFAIFAEVIVPHPDTVSIECCHPAADGKFTDETYDSLVKLTAWLCKQLDLSPKDVIRHYDVTGKACPKYFVDHEDAWKQFRKDVKKAMRKDI